MARTGGMRILLLGATGTIGQAALRALVRRGHDVVCLVRRGGVQGAEARHCDLTDPLSVRQHGIRGDRFDAVVSCLASRSGVPRDAWAVDHRAHLHVLQAAEAAGAGHMLLVSAICVQKPKLAFQHAKLAFETALQQSGMTWTIVRPTAFFKSLSGQVDRLRQGKAFLMFGDGALTACKPISDGDLAAYLADCLEDRHAHNRILPIGGPGPAITPHQQGQALFRLLGMAPRYRRVPVALLDAIIGTLGAVGRVRPSLADKAELARIGRYYATESMLVWNPADGRYEADATPETGSETLFDFYARLIRGEVTAERGEHAVF